MFYIQFFKRNQLRNFSDISEASKTTLGRVSPVGTGSFQDKFDMKHVPCVFFENKSYPLVWLGLVDVEIH